MTDFAVVLVGAAALFILGLAALVVVTRVYGASLPLRVRLVLSVIALLAGQYLIAFALLLLGWFGSGSLAVIVGLSAVVVVAALRDESSREWLRQDVEHVREVAVGVPFEMPWTLLLAVPACLTVLHAIRGTLTPVWDWDVLTYHATRAAFWLQEGTLRHSYEAVGWWDAYRAFPIAGDTPTAWAMALGPTDAAVAPVWMVVWLGLGLGAYSATRGLGGDRVVALLGAVALMTVPAALIHMTTAYVDNAVALTVLCGVVCFVEAEARGRLDLANAGLAALALGVAIKLTAVPLLLVGGLCWLWLSGIRAQTPWTTMGMGLLPTLTLVLPWPALLFRDTGNPVYPFGVGALGFAGSPKLSHGGRVLEVLPLPEAGLAVFVGGFGGLPFLHNGLGLGGLLLLVTGMVALRHKLNRRTITFALMTLVAVSFLLFILARRINFPGLDHGRYMLIAPALATVALASHPSGRVRVVLGAAIVCQLFYALPWRWGALEFPPVLACFAVGVGVAGMGRLGRRTFPWSLPVGLLAALLMAAGLRPSYKWSYFDAVAKGEVMGSGPIYTHAFPVWRALSDAEPMTVAVSAGPNPLPTHWNIYPLVGDRRQHVLVHLMTSLHYPEDREGLGPAELERAGEEWIGSLRDQDVDALVVIAPESIEYLWALQFPEHFTLHTQGDLPETALFMLK